MKIAREFLTALAGLPITIVPLLYLGACAAMAKIKGEFDPPKTNTPAR